MHNQPEERRVLAENVALARILLEDADVEAEVDRQLSNGNQLQEYVDFQKAERALRILMQSYFVGEEGKERLVVDNPEALNNVRNLIVIEGGLAPNDDASEDPLLKSLHRQVQHLIIVLFGNHFSLGHLAKRRTVEGIENRDSIASSDRPASSQLQEDRCYLMGANKTNSPSEEALAAELEHSPVFTKQDSSDIDYSFLDRIYRFISAFDDVEMQKHALKTIATVCDRLQKFANRFDRPMYTRFILIFLRCPFYESLVHFDSYLEVLRCISLLPRGGREILLQWLVETPLKVFEMMLQTVRFMFTVVISQFTSEGMLMMLCSGVTYLRHGFNYLRILYEANAIRQLREESDEIMQPSFYQTRYVNAGTLKPYNHNYLRTEEFQNEIISITPQLLLEDFSSYMRHKELPFKILINPFILELKMKLMILSWDSYAQQRIEMRKGAFMMADAPVAFVQPFLVLEIRRNNLVEDALDNLVRAQSRVGGLNRLKKPLKVVFKGEEGVDEGGVAKEFFQLLVMQLFNPDYGMFNYFEDSRCLWFKPLCSENGLSVGTPIQFELMGIVLGLALYNEIMLDLRFPLALYKKLLSRLSKRAAHSSTAHSSVAPPSTPSPAHSPVEAAGGERVDYYADGQTKGEGAYYGIGGALPPTFPNTSNDDISNLPEYVPSLGDLQDFLPDVASSLRKLIEMPADQVESLALDFSVTVEEFGEYTPVNLIDDPEHPLYNPTEPAAVTAENRFEYVKKVLDFYLVKSISYAFQSFYKGFNSCCGGGYLRMFTPSELETAICGYGGELDFDELEQGARYQDGYTASSPSIQLFWKIIKKFNLTEKKNLLFFITGSDRTPIGGLKSLKLIIGNPGGNKNRIPTAHTCYNFLLLPDAQDEELMEKNLRIAIANRHGFGLR